MMFNFKVPDLDSKRALLLGVFAVAGVALLLFAGFLYLNRAGLSVSDLFGTKQVGDGLPAEAQGKIYLTLVPTDNSLFQGLYFFDIASEKLEKLFVGENASFITNDFSPRNKNVMAFVALDRNTGDKQIFTGNNVSYVIKKITKSDTKRKIDPEWSPNGKKIAFSARGSVGESDGSLVPEDWSVYVTNLKGKEIFISKGIYPKWSPDGKKLLIMKNDGLYVYKSNGRGDGNMAWKTVGGPARFSMKIDVSADGKMIAWSNVVDGEVVLIKVVSWDPFEGSVYKRLKTHSFWPTFSKDGRFLAVQEIDFNVENSNPRLVIYNLKTFERKIVLDLRDYNPKAMFVSDWQ